MLPISLVFFTLLSDGFTPRKTFLEGKKKKNATVNSETVFTGSDVPENLFPNSSFWARLP